MIALRLDLEADRPEPEHALHRNVTMIPVARRRGSWSRAEQPPEVGYDFLGLL